MAAFGSDKGIMVDWEPQVHLQKEVGSAADVRVVKKMKRRERRKGREKEEEKG